MTKSSEWEFNYISFAKFTARLMHNHLCLWTIRGTKMIGAAHLSFAVLLASTIVTLAHAQQGGCYSTGQGPIMSCFEGNRKITVMKPFKYRDGNFYAWDHKLRTYCSRNNNPSCFQIGQVKVMRCTEAKEGQLFCE